MTAINTLFFGRRGQGKRKQPEPIPLPSPSPMPLVLEETEEAKRQVRGRKRGRPSTILAGRLTSNQGKTVLGE